MKLVARKLIFINKISEKIKQMPHNKSNSYKQIPNENDSDTLSDSSIETKPGWERVPLSTTSSTGTRPEWRGPTITSDLIMILGESTRYRLMALVLVLSNMSSKKSNQFDFEPLEESSEAASTDFEYESSKKTLEESTDTQAESLKISLELIANKVIEWGQTWPQYYKNANLSNIIKNINDWFNYFNTSSMQNSIAVIIKCLIYDCFEAFVEKHNIIYQLNSLINYTDVNTGFRNPHQIIINQIKRGTKFKDICFDNINFEDKKQFYILYSHVFQSLQNVKDLVSEFISHYPQAKINGNEKTQFTCSPCCSIQ